MNKIITIEREFGSGGREVAKRTADILEIAYYDEEIVDKTATETQYSHDYIKQFSESSNSRHFPLVFGHTLTTPPLSPVQEIQIAQIRIVEELANLSNCIIVGRCGSHTVKNVNLFKVFIYSSDMEQRIGRCYDKVPEDRNKTPQEMKKLILATDKSRSKYFNSYTAKTWNNMSEYNLCIDTAKIPVKQAAELVAQVYNTLM